ncbi:MAG: branched-chain amino acid ABC transporter substrate-binding protein [Alphaproteobacteria bacterium]|nr:branched-chain amino acid ABC transporter substrate-binding protein [Alphaproteobacteria bacterium]
MKKLLLTGVAIGFAAALSAGSALADLSVATVGPISGQLAALGEQYSQGAKKAVADINAAGGINGEKLVLEIGDDACDPKQAVNVANHEEEGILMITPASTNPKLTDEGGWNVARVCGRDDAQGKVAGAYIAKSFAGKKVAIVDDKSAYGKGLADETRKALNANGLTEVLNESINAGEKDYSALVSKLKDAGVDAVYFGGYHPEAGLILKQMGEQGLGAKMFSGDSMNNVELWTIAGPAAQNMFFTFAPEPRNIPEAKAIVDQFKASGYDPEGYTLYTYAAFQMFKQAAEATKSLDNQKIAEWLRAGNTTKTVLGDITLDKKGDIVNPVYVWYNFKDGNYAEVPDMK